MKKFIFAFGLLLSAQVSAANLIVNGGFEDYTVAAGTAAHISTDGTCPSNGDVSCIQNVPAFDWIPSVGAPNEFLEVRNSFFGSAQEGNNFAELTPSALSGITQTFTASAGTGLLSWFDKGRVSNWNYEVLLNGFSIFNGATFDVDAWTNRSFVVDLLAGTNTLTFNALTSDGDKGAQIDNISLEQSTVTTAVPEPETYGMMMLGLVMLGFAARRRKV